MIEWGGMETNSFDKMEHHFFSCQILGMLNQRLCFEVFRSVLNESLGRPHQTPKNHKTTIKWSVCVGSVVGHFCNLFCCDVSVRRPQSITRRTFFESS